MKHTRVSVINIVLKRPLGEFHIGLFGYGVHGVFATAADEFTGVAMATGEEGRVSNGSRKERRVGRKRRSFQTGKESEEIGEGGIGRDKTEPENMTRLIEFDGPLRLTTMAFSIICRHDLLFLLRGSKSPRFWD